MNARYYDPETGRFISQDTYRGTGEGFWHLYLYCNSDPVNNIDPTGHRKVKINQYSKSGSINFKNKKIINNFKIHDIRIKYYSTIILEFIYLGKLYMGAQITYKITLNIYTSKEDADLTRYACEFIGESIAFAITKNGFATLLGGVVGFVIYKAHQGTDGAFRATIPIKKIYYY